MTTANAILRSAPRSRFTLAAFCLLAASSAAFAVLGCGSRQNATGRTGLLAVGDSMPAFSARDQENVVRVSAEFAGKPIVVYFYPRDATPGCTAEACAFRDAWERMQATGAIVLGVSTDGVDAHRSFANEHHLPFPLLADTSGEITGAFGVPIALGMAQRVTFIVGRNGKVATVFPDVDPGVHVEEVLNALEAIR